MLGDGVSCEDGVAEEEWVGGGRVGETPGDQKTGGGVWLHIEWSGAWQSCMSICEHVSTLSACNISTYVYTHVIVATKHWPILFVHLFTHSVHRVQW